MEVKLKSGKTYKLKTIDRDTLDDMLDEVVLDPDTGVPKKLNKTITLWFRKALEVDEEALMPKNMSLTDRTELFTILQDKYLMGEEKASSSK